MIDREKVIKGLECIGGYMHMATNPCTDCEYNECQTYAICVGEVARDALLLLKEEAAEVVEEERRVLWDETDDGPVYTHDVFYHCPSCNLILSRTHKDKDINFCENCGQAVKWDD